MRIGGKIRGSRFRVDCERIEPKRPGHPHPGNQKVAQPEESHNLRGWMMPLQPHTHTRTKTTDSTGDPLTITR